MMNSQQHENNYPVCADDEIDLVDLFLVLWRRKYMILITGVMFIIIGVVYVFNTPMKYKYTTSIEVGKFYPEGATGGTALLEPLDNVRSKLEENYIPSIWGEFAQNDLFELSKVKVGVKVPKDSDLLLIESQGVSENADKYYKAHEAVLEKLIDNHASLTEELKSEVKAELARAQFQLSKLKDERLFEFRKKDLNDRVNDAQRELDKLKNEKIFAVKRDKLKDEIEKAKALLDITKDPELFLIKEKALEERIKNSERDLIGLKEERENLVLDIEDLEKLKVMLEGDLLRIKNSIEQNLQTRAQAAKESDSAPNAMTLLLMDNQIQQSQSELQDIRERLEIGIAKKRRALEKALKENSRSIEAKQAELEQLQLQMKKLNIDHEFEINTARQSLENLQRKYDQLIIEHNIEQEEAKQRVEHLKRQLNKLDADHQNAIKEQELTVSRLKNEVSLIKNTDALGIAVRSINPEGPKKALILALSGVLGIMGGIFLAFGAEFMAKVRRQQAEMEV
jgi:hypothetical protein